MIPEQLRLPLLDFAEQVSRIPKCSGVVVFGSAVTGDLSKKSDIDVLLIFDTDHDPEIGTEAEQAHAIASAISTRYDLSYPFSLVFMSTAHRQEIEPDFLWNVANEGVVIWGKPTDLLMKIPHPALEPLLLITYSLKTLNETKKRKLLRWLYTAKKRILDKKQTQLGPGVLLLKAEQFKQIKPIFDQFHVRYQVRKIWGH